MTWKHCVLVAALVIASPTAYSAGFTGSELTAALVYRFASFVEWPPDAIGEGPVVIGVLGADDVSDALETMTRGRSIEGRSLKVERLDDVRRANRCHIVFMGSKVADRRQALLEAIGTANVLTLSDSDGFVGRGGMVEFVRHRRRVAFKVHRGAVARAELRVSPRILELAEEVQGDAPADLP